MGIRIHSAIAYGVQFTKAESLLYEKALKGKPSGILFMKWVERELFEENAKTSIRRYNSHHAYKFIKFTRNHKPMKPYQPIWADWSEEKLSKICIISEAIKNLVKHERLAEGRGLDELELWEPYNDGDKPSRILAIVAENNYAREVDYGLVDHFKISGLKNKIIPIKGRYPWEAGTEKDKDGTWFTFNGQHMIPNLPQPILRKILFHPGPKKDFIRLKKNLWDKYHGHLRPYLIYSGDGWWGTDFHFYPADLLFQTVADLVPGIKYDVMRLQKLLCFYWS
jgi:hypothetical protein